MLLGCNHQAMPKITDTKDDIQNLKIQNNAHWRDVQKCDWLYSLNAGVTDCSFYVVPVIVQNSLPVLARSLFSYLSRLCFSYSHMRGNNWNIPLSFAQLCLFISKSS